MEKMDREEIILNELAMLFVQLEMLLDLFEIKWYQMN